MKITIRCVAPTCTIPGGQVTRATKFCTVEPYVGRSSCKVSYFFFSGSEADRNVKVVGGDVAVL